MKNTLFLIGVLWIGGIAGAYGDQAHVIETSVTAKKTDGQILNSKPWPPLPTFESLDDFGRNYFPRGVYEEARRQQEFDVLEITYASDGLPVRGMLIKPKVPGTRKWPAIIFNRGGNGELGRITDSGQPCCRVNTSCLDVADSTCSRRPVLWSSPPTTATRASP